MARCCHTSLPLLATVCVCVPDSPLAWSTQVRCLLENGANVNHPTKDGQLRTPLQQAMMDEEGADNQHQQEEMAQNLANRAALSEEARLKQRKREVKCALFLRKRIEAFMTEVKETNSEVAEGKASSRMFVFLHQWGNRTRARSHMTLVEGSSSTSCANCRRCDMPNASD